jgi:MarR family transcriptional regulator for hemolysin
MIELADTPSAQPLVSPHATYEDFWLHVSQASRLWRKRLDQSLAPHGLTDASGRALLCIFRYQPTLLAQSELAELLSLDRSAIVRLVDALGEQGYVERRESKDDRRIKQLVLTPAGEKVAKLAAQVARQLREELFSTLSAETIAVTHRGLQQICQRLQASSD